MITTGLNFNREKFGLPPIGKGVNPVTNLEAVEKALSLELAQSKPNEAVIASCGLFKAACERKPDIQAYPPEGPLNNELPWWIK